MSDRTRKRFEAALAAHVEARAAAELSGQDPGLVPRGDLVAAAEGHARSEPSLDDLRDAYEAAQAEDRHGAAAQRAAERLAAARQAARVVEGRPVTPTVGG